MRQKYEGKITMNNDIDISIIIPTWNVSHRTENGQQTIVKLIRSIVDQVHVGMSIETIFVDDMSTDNTVDILQKQIKDFPQIDGKLYCLDNKAGSPYVGWNVGIEHALGTFVMFADADDFFGSKGTLYDMFVHAVEWESDVVSGKLGNAGRGTSRQQFRYGNMPETDFNLSNPMSPFSTFGRLFKRNILNWFKIRYVEDIVPRADMQFLANVYLNDELNFSVYADNVIYSWNKPEQGTLSETMRKDPDFLSDRRKQDTRIIKMVAEAKSKNDVVKAGILNKTVKGIGFNAFFNKVDDDIVLNGQRRAFYEVKQDLKTIMNDSILSFMDFETELIIKLFMNFDYFEAKKMFSSIKAYTNLDDGIEIFSSNSALIPESPLQIVNQSNQYNVIIGNQTTTNIIAIDKKEATVNANSFVVDGQLKLLFRNRSDTKRFCIDLQNAIQTVDLSNALEKFTMGEKVDMVWKIESKFSIILKPVKMADFEKIERPFYKIFENYLGNVTIKRVNKE